MCNKLPYCNPRIDVCLREEINWINNFDRVNGFRTIASCCGHGKYPKTIIIQDRQTGWIFERESGIKIAEEPRKSRKYYKRDAEGYYYIPECIHIINEVRTHGQQTT